MPRIFISHSSKDNAFAERLALALRARGADVWIDLSDIPAGMKWSTAIQQGLDSCELMILVISPDSMGSTNVEDEWQYYIDDKKLIVPIRWIPAKVHFQLRRHQYVDFHQQEFDAALAQLVKELARNGFAANSTPPPAPPRIQGGAKENTPAAAPPLLVSERGSGGEVRTFPRILKPDWVGKIIPAPFEWCVVPAGKVTLEPSRADNDYLKQTQIFEVPEFQIARYPITNAQFEVFVTAKDGWRDPQWWYYADEARIWRKEHTQFEPAAFKDCADCPRETVSWYSAVAFTRWLSAKTGEKITLLNEQEWQRAAQGDDGRIYPWGKEWDAAKCNSKESEIGRTTPVTHYPQGASSWGVVDMSGNVWEWCSTNWETGINDLDGVNVRVVRGGAWNYYMNNALAGYRYFWRPGVRNLNLGFRIASS